MVVVDIEAVEGLEVAVGVQRRVPRKKKGALFMHSHAGSR